MSGRAGTYETARATAGRTERGALERFVPTFLKTVDLIATSSDGGMWKATEMANAERERKLARMNGVVIEMLVSSEPSGTPPITAVPTMSPNVLKALARSCLHPLQLLQLRAQQR